MIVGTPVRRVPAGHPPPHPHEAPSIAATDLHCLGCDNALSQGLFRCLELPLVKLEGRVDRRGLLEVLVATIPAASPAGIVVDDIEPCRPDSLTESEIGPKDRRRFESDRRARKKPLVEHEGNATMRAIIHLQCERRRTES